jgi:hypothetical protein
MIAYLGAQIADSASLSGSFCGSGHNSWTWSRLGPNICSDSRSILGKRQSHSGSGKN